MVKNPDNRKNFEACFEKEKRGIKLGFEESADEAEEKAEL